MQAVDPIFAEIERFRAAQRDMMIGAARADGVEAQRDGRTVTLDDIAADADASVRYGDALDRLASTPPTTLAGMVAALQVLLPLDLHHHAEWLVETATASLAE